MDGWVLQFDAVEGEGFKVAEFLFHDGYLHTDDDVADDLACSGFMGGVVCREMRRDEVDGRSGDGDGCLGGAGSSGSVMMLGDCRRCIWRRGWYVDRGKEGTNFLGFRSSRGVRVLGDGGACSLRRALGSIVGISDVTLPLLLGIMGGFAIDFFGIQDRDGSRGSECMTYTVRIVKVC